MHHTNRNDCDGQRRRRRIKLQIERHVSQHILVILCASHCHPLQSTLFRSTRFFTSSKRKLRTMFWIYYYFGTHFKSCGWMRERVCCECAKVVVGMNFFLFFRSAFTIRLRYGFIFGRLISIRKWYLKNVVRELFQMNVEVQSEIQ